MRIESRVFSVGWIPSEAVRGPFKTMMDKRLGAHYDDPPPAHIDDLEPLRATDAFRFANNLRAHVEFDDWRWGALDETPELIVPFKRAVYEQVVAAFGGFARGG